MDDSILKEVYGMKDSRSLKGILSRGKNVYGNSHAAHKGGGSQYGRPSKSAVQRRMKQRGKLKK